MKKLLMFLGIIPKVNKVKSYELTKHGYQDLMSEDYTLYDLARSYMLDCAQKWDTDAHTQAELKHIMSFVHMPFSTPKRKEMSLLKKDFKTSLNKVDCDLTAKDGGYKIAVVKIANVLLEFKYRSKKLRG